MVFLFGTDDVRTQISLGFIQNLLVFLIKSDDYPQHAIIKHGTIC